MIGTTKSGYTARRAWEEREGRAADDVLNDLYKKTFDIAFDNQPWQEDVGGEQGFQECGAVLSKLADDERRPELKAPAKREVRALLRENRKDLRDLGVIDGNGNPVEPSS